MSKLMASSDVQFEALDDQFSVLYDQSVIRVNLVYTYEHTVFQYQFIQ